MNLHENLKRYRIAKNLTQEEMADFLGITAQSVSKWERGETYPDITLLPAIANILERSVDELLEMNVIRSEETRLAIHAKANEYCRTGDYLAAERVYRDALLTYPNKPGMILGLAGVLALQGNAEEAIEWMERGLPLSINEKQKATSRAVLCFLYLKAGNAKKASSLASTLPHTRESREVIQPVISNGLSADEIQSHIQNILINQ
ncbi:MAG: helix-turn-helix domain-containing protein [Lachnospiraceae bacterium]|jgi:transcriptional regulator with XRE-family HTH domain|nr:helix-turn-helix domain-containing protein [Lachnospiraceae bacterium]